MHKRSRRSMIQFVLTVLLMLVAASPGPQESPTVQFVDSGQVLGGEGGHGAALGDLDGDGALDFIATNQERICGFWLNDGRGGFTGLGAVLGAPGALSISLADVDGYSDLDALLGTMEGKGENRIHLNQRLAAGGWRTPAAMYEDWFSPLCWSCPIPPLDAPETLGSPPAPSVSGLSFLSVLHP